MAHPDPQIRQEGGGGGGGGGGGAPPPKGGGGGGGGGWGGRSSRPTDKGCGVSKKVFRALWASIWSKN